MVSRKLLSLWLVLNFFVFWAVWLYTTGYSAEGYLPWESGKAEQYSPYVYTPPGDRPVEILYMVDVNGTVHYYIVWEDEHFSNPIIDRLYRLFRRLAYRGSTKDVEVVEVNPDTGEFYFQTNGHTGVRGLIGPEGNCLVLETGKSVPNCTANGTHLKVYVVTWNHMLCLTPENGTSLTKDVPLRKMGPVEYSSLMMRRRIQKTIWGVAVDSVTFALGVTALLNVVLFSVLGWRKKRK